MFLHTQEQYCYEVLIDLSVSAIKKRRKKWVRFFLDEARQSFEKPSYTAMSGLA